MVFCLGTFTASRTIVSANVLSRGLLIAHAHQPSCIISTYLRLSVPLVIPVVTFGDVNCVNRYPVFKHNPVCISINIIIFVYALACWQCLYTGEV